MVPEERPPGITRFRSENETEVPEGAGVDEAAGAAEGATVGGSDVGGSGVSLAAGAAVGVGGAAGDRLQARMRAESARTGRSLDALFTVFLWG